MPATPALRLLWAIIMLVSSHSPAGLCPAYTIRTPPSILQWKLNPKLNVSILPVWDGKDETIIDYVINMVSLALLGPLIFVHIAQMVPTKFTGCARSWWTLLPPNSKILYSRDWSHLLDVLRWHFLTAKWLGDRLQEFEEMHFQQKGCSKEELEDFFQRRIQYHSFVLSDVEDGPQAISHILRTRPVAWYCEVSECTCPSIEVLMTYTKHNRTSLIASYLLENKVNVLLGSTPPTDATPRMCSVPRSAKAADTILDHIDDGSEDEETGLGEEEKERLEYLAIIVESKIELSRACLSEDPEKHKKVLEALSFEPVAAEGPTSRNHKPQVLLEDEAEDLSPEPMTAGSIQQKVLVVEASTVESTWREAFIVEASVTDKAVFLRHYRMSQN
ncbi:hypothetical protein DFH08DRAFT_974795 [Mycena albidolilacea]|uniref:Uncharacterized protein n=1 Tax=Mycena albidolilacea TaxID=1033008 RepID=A0AAD6Z5X4_9AGAR|nr:hypothetical protein DFH08DRAFT_974795 [Mycena albidolilacea]